MAVGSRLAYYRQSADAEYWDQVWQKQDTKQLYENAQQGDLDYYEEIFLRHLPIEGRILEAGCGRGQIAIALRARGYDVEGVDFGAKTVAEVKSRFPELPIRVGDVTNLDVPDGCYKGYISLGVMEHLEQGPSPFLEEAYRILSKDGIALISVPYLNWLRRTKLRLGLFTGKNTARLPFYQYAYSANEFNHLLQEAGFDPVAHYQYGGYKGIKDELTFFDQLFNLPQLGWRLRKFLMNWRWADQHMGHMMMYVCRKLV